MKIFLRNVHLYLALAAGLVIMLSCATGAILVFEDELDHMVNSKRYEVVPGDERLPLEALLKKLRQHNIPKAKLSAVKVFTDPRRSVEFAMVLSEKKGMAPQRDKEAVKGNEKKAKGGGKPGLFVYINPYTGQVLDVYNKRESFFFKVEMLHRFLLGGQNSIGKTIIGLSTLSFLIITLTGIVLWWPKNKKILIQRLKFKTDGSFKRLNHDLHIVTGFYTSLFLLVIIFTGLVMAFNWVNKGIFTLTGSSMESPEPPSSVYQPGRKAISMAQAIQMIDLKAVEFYTIRTPKDSAGIYAVNVLPKGSMDNKAETYFVDQYSGAVIGQLKFADKNLGQRIRSYIKPIHTGELFGMPTKIINFILALVTFSFPITGVIMWLNRIKKRRAA